jgi:hypothetical protein
MEKTILENQILIMTALLQLVNSITIQKQLIQRIQFTESRIKAIS